MNPARDISGYRKYWPARFGTAPFLPMSRAEMDALGWDSCDVIVVTGDGSMVRMEIVPPKVASPTVSAVPGPRSTITWPISSLVKNEEL